MDAYSIREIRLLLGAVLVVVELNAETVVRYRDVDRRQRIQSRREFLPRIRVRMAILRSAGGRMVRRDLRAVSSSRCRGDSTRDALQGHLVPKLALLGAVDDD